MRLFLAVALLAVLVTATAVGHTERPSYFPAPEADNGVTPPAGGKVPKARSLRSALRKKPPGVTRVVCKRSSMLRLRRSIRRARKDGYAIRPTDVRPVSRKQAKRLLRVNRRLKKLCKYSEIQPAVTASRNNDRVVVMPGLYTEPTSRAKPTNDPKCDEFETNGDRPNETGALSFTYQFNCPNDQNLIAVIGREPGTGEDPSPPNFNRHGIPNLGPCIRCNFQIEGSGIGADEVIVDSGDASKRNKGPSGIGSKKDVGIRADRADGFVLRNMTFRHAKEHGIYVHETDGYLLDRFKAFYNGLYGTLTFASDHGVHQDCEAVGHGDSGIYPGGAPETGRQRPEGTPFRYNQEIRRCDLHHNLAGYSGTNGNAVHLNNNDIYDNALGIQTDVVTGAGHPGYPGDSALFEENNIYSNNFNPYDPGGDVIASFPFPVGTAMWIAGGNNHTVRNNRIWDNWRRGTMLFAVPDSLICGPAADDNQQAGCNPNGFSTSYDNRYYGNVMGTAPDGTAAPNGTDFWWDSYPNNTGNCWYANTGSASITMSPDPLPDCDGGSNPSESVGTGSPENEGELVSCLVAFETGEFDPDSSPCPWFDNPSKPGSAAASAAAQAEERTRMRQAFLDFCEDGSAPLCERSGSR